MTVVNSIVDGNLFSGTGGDVENSSGSIYSTGGNLFGIVSGTPITGPGTKDYYDPTGNPGLGLLQNNGGPTQTLAELPGSHALNRGITSGTTSGGLNLVLPATDQRGFQRVVKGSIDAGAFENQSQWFNVAGPASPQSADAGSPASIQLGSFTYTGNAGSLWIVTVNWGDGTPGNPDLTTFSTTQAGNLGALKHTYTTAGSPTVTITITDGDNNFQQGSFSVTVNSAIAISPASVPAGIVNGVYPTQTFTPSNGSGSFTNVQETGTLPTGLIFTPGTTSATLSGTPTQAGTFTFTVTATDSIGGTGSQTYNLVVAPPSLVVTNTNDSGAGSLRQAITNAENYYTNGIITFAPSVTGIITLASTLAISNGLSIQGPGASMLAISGNNLYQDFHIDSHGNVQISGLTISHGGNVLSGGGVYVKTGGNLALSNDVIANNSATSAPAFIPAVSPRLPTSPSRIM